jgi:hypothetical protein
MERVTVVHPNKTNAKFDFISTTTLKSIFLEWPD